MKIQCWKFSWNGRRLYVECNDKEVYKDNWNQPATVADISKKVRSFINATGPDRLVSINESEHVQNSDKVNIWIIWCWGEEGDEAVLSGVRTGPGRGQPVNRFPWDSES